MHPELELALKDLVDTEGVYASAVVTRDGIIVESLGMYDLSALSALSSVVAMMTRTAEKCASLLKKGDLEELITKADDGVIVTEKCGMFIFLVAVDKSFDFDTIKPKMGKIRDTIMCMP